MTDSPHAIGTTFERVLEIHARMRSLGPPLVKVPGDVSLPLSHAQGRMWFLSPIRS